MHRRRRPGRHGAEVERPDQGPHHRHVRRRARRRRSDRLEEADPADGQVARRRRPELRRPTRAGGSLRRDRLRGVDRCEVRGRSGPDRRPDLGAVRDRVSSPGYQQRLRIHLGITAGQRRPLAGGGQGSGPVARSSRAPGRFHDRDQAAPDPVPDHQRQPGADLRGLVGDLRQHAPGRALHANSPPGRAAESARRDDHACSAWSRRRNWSTPRAASRWRRIRARSGWWPGWRSSSIEPATSSSAASRRSDRTGGSGRAAARTSSARRATATTTRWSWGSRTRSRRSSWSRSAMPISSPGSRRSTTARPSVRPSWCRR